MRWKIDAIIETRYAGPASEAEARKQVQAELWRLVEGLEAALGTSMATSVHILGVEPLSEEEA
jgi:hypothetical protein